MYGFEEKDLIDFKRVIQNHTVDGKDHKIMIVTAFQRVEDNDKSTITA